ncbi:Copia protein, partial [Mucuna pruriens]
MNMVRITFSLPAQFGWNLQQFDVKNVLLHGDLEEEVYMESPLGLYSHNEKNKVYRLKKQCILTLLLLYVDDMIVIDDDDIKKLSLKEKLTTQFELKELEKLKYFLGIEENYDARLHGYLLNRTIELGVKKASLRKGLLLRKEGTLSIEIYTDVDYAGSIVDRRSTFGYCMFLGGNLVKWRSNKQNVIASSSVEEKFRVWHTIYMKDIILDDLKVKYKGLMKLFYDNNSTISIAHNLIQHNRTKHIEIDKYFMKRKLDSRLIITKHVPIRP